MKNYFRILDEQLSVDFCCTPEEAADSKNHFLLHRFLPGRREYLEKEECYLKIAAVHGKLLFSGKKEIIDWCRQQYAETGGEWFFEMKNLHRLNERFYQDGYQIAIAHPFFIPAHAKETDSRDFEIRWYEGDEIEQFRGDSRFTHAYAFCVQTPDVIGAAALKNGKILGMAGASCDSPKMWQIGIDVDQTARHQGIGKMLVSILKNEILKKEILPFYGTGMSHLESQRVALGSGFTPAWVELVTERIKKVTVQNPDV